jgi:S1-C subfamily serine protease
MALAKGRRFCDSSLLLVFALFPASAIAQNRTSASEVFKKASPSLVTISTPDWFGSGVLIDATGVVVTNLHVIRGAEKATVRLASGDTYDDVRVVNVDARKDLALLKINGSQLPVALLGDSDDVEIGHRVYAIGAPKGLELTISEGIVSGRRDSGEGHQLLQTSTAISSGSSGGGLFDETGRLIGITTSKILDGENLNFAVPTNYVREILGLTTRWTLGELKAHLVATTGNAGAEPSSGMTALDGIPRLAQFYTNTTGEIAVVEQASEGSVRVSFSTGGYIYGGAVLQWDAVRKGFVGKGTQKTFCGTFDKRVWDAPVDQEIFLLNDMVIRDRWTHPVKVDCRKGVVRSYSSQEVLWYVPSQQ